MRTNGVDYKMSNKDYYDSVNNIMNELDMGEEDIYNYFSREIETYKKHRKQDRINSKELYKALKKRLKLNNYTGLNKRVLPYSVHYADILRHNSYDNKVALFNYAYFGIKNLTIGNIDIYKEFKDYTIKYDKLSKLMARKVLSNDDNLDLIEVNDYVEKSINSLNNQNEDLTDHVFQIVRTSQKVKSKRIF